MNTYIGLDVSQSETHICVIDANGKKVWEGVCLTSPTAIFDKIKTKVPNPKIVGFESGPLSTWLWHELTALGLPAVCMDARHANLALSASINKTDRNDAQGLARLLYAGFYKEVAVKTMDNHRVRAAVGARAQIVRGVVDFKNQIRGLLKVKGTILTRRQLAKLREHPNAFHDESIRVLHEVVEFLDKKVHELDKSLMQTAKKDETIKRLMRIPGVGPVTAVTYVATIDDPGRFKNSRNVGAYLGLTPRRYQSGEMDIVGRISKCGDGLLRGYLYEAAGVLLLRTRSTSPLQEWALRLKARTGAKKAKVALARKLAVIMHRMLITGEEYRPSDAAAVPSAA